MVKPTRKPKMWAILFFYVFGVPFIAYGPYRWATNTPAELQEWSTGRGIALPGWGWITLSFVVGLTMLAFASWALRWRRRWN